MKKKVILDLIRYHYLQEHQAYFNTCLEVLKEFKDTDPILFEDLSNFLKPFVSVIPKKPFVAKSAEINFEDAGNYMLVPQDEKVSIE